MATVSSISKTEKDSEVFVGAKWLSPTQLTGAKNVTGECGQTSLPWGQAPNGEFWNGSSKRFILAPAFGFNEIPGAVSYEYETIDDFHRVTRFSASTPNETVRDWDKLPTGYVTYICHGIGKDGEMLPGEQRRVFWKKAAFREGAYPAAKRTYALARRKIFDYLLNMPQTHYLAENGKPDKSYYLNGYPSKILGSEIRGIVSFVKTSGMKQGLAETDAIINIARKAADYLISDAVPAGQVCEYFTRTYDKDGCEYGRFKGEQDTIMLIYPAQAASAILELYSFTGEQKYLDAAQRTAETYIRLQGDDGTWPLRMNAVTGESPSAHRLLPLGVIDFLEVLYAVTPKPEYRAAADRAFQFVENGPMLDWNWEGQFEDTASTSKYRNLTKHPACDTALYLLKRFPGDAKRLEQAKALLQFAEDQFVEWEPPYGNRYGERTATEPDDGSWSYFCLPYSTWQTPCALEQYNCYWPIDASAAKLINTFLAVYKATGDKLFLAKAKALGDTATRVQEDDGLVITWWIKGVQRNDYRYHTWINCMLATANALGNLSTFSDLHI